MIGKHRKLRPASESVEIRRRALRQSRRMPVGDYHWAGTDTRRELQQQDRIGNLGTVLYETDSITDEYARNALRQAQAKPTYEGRKQAYLLLESMIINGHPHGMASDVYNELQDAWTMDSNKQ